MIRALAFYLYAAGKNRIAARGRRLRQPRYLIPVLAGAAYLALLFGRQVAHTGMRPSPLSAASGLSVLESAFSLLLFATLALPWIWPGNGPGIHFTEAEVQFLFAAPISRKSLLRFRLLKSQLGILFGVLVSVLFFGRGLSFAHPAFFIIGLWVVYSFLSLYRMATSLTKASLAEHGIFGIRHHLWGIGALAVMAVSVVVWLWRFVPALQGGGAPVERGVLDWFVAATHAGPASWFLLPCRWLVRPAFAGQGLDFLQRLAPAAAMLVAAYLWIMRADVHFEEASLQKAREVSARIEARRRGFSGARPAPTPRVRRPLFRLRPHGPAFVAFFWKNLVSVVRFISPRSFMGVLAILVVILMLAATKRDAGEIIPVLLGSMAGAATVFVAFVGPLLARDDLRADLLQVDLLKGYPVRGWEVVLGEILAPTAVLAVLEWGLLTVAVVLLPNVGERALTPAQRIVFGLALAAILPCITAAGVLSQNAAALILPGWVQLGREHARGVEAMGQRLLTMAGTVVVLLVAALPAAVLFALAYFASHWLLGWVAILPAALAAVAGLLLESAAAVVLLGRILDRFDASLELDNV